MRAVRSIGGWKIAAEGALPNVERLLRCAWRLTRISISIECHTQMRHARQRIYCTMVSSILLDRSARLWIGRGKRKVSSGGLTPIHGNSPRFDDCSRLHLRAETYRREGRIARYVL